MALLTLLSQHAFGLDVIEAKGLVYHDTNGNSKYDSGEPGVPGVGVSNGEGIVETDAEGRYVLDVDDDTVLFVIKPAGWQVPLSPKTNLPQFYYNHKPEGSPKLHFGGVAPTGPLPESVDFPLVKAEESGPLKVVCLGDTQPRNQEEVDYVSHAIVEELAGVDAHFGMTLGDLVFDDLRVLEPITQSIGLIGIPWYHVIGNHDNNYDAPTRWHADDTYERIFGPSYYSFNYGDVHFIALNDIFWEVETREYHAELGEPQLTFIRNDLARVPQDKLVVLLMHIPFKDLVDLPQLFEMLAPFPKTFSIAAHWHRQEHFFLGKDKGWKQEEPHHHLVSATACGSWWTGNQDPVGIPVATMADGAPNGYSLITFNGTDYEVEYKVARRPADYQMNIFAPEVITTAEASQTEVVVNVFAGSERSIVEMRAGDSDEWQPLAKYQGPDPYFVKQDERERMLLTEIARDSGIEQIDDEVLKAVQKKYQPLLGRGLPEPAETGHLWKGTLPAGMEPGYHLLHVRTKDMFGNEYTAKRVIRVE
jgi:hypothetical protein